MAGTNALSPDGVLDLVVKALGEGQPSLKTPYEAVALVGHASMAAVGFRLVGLGEDHNLGWNTNDAFAFRYAHEQSSMQYLLKVSRLGNNAVVNALALGDDRTSSFDLPVKDYISGSALPLSTTENITSAVHNVFISSARLVDLIGLFKINVIQKLAPGLYKEGYEDTNRARGARPEEAPRHDPLRDDSLPQPARPYPFDDPLAAGPRMPNPPDFAPPGFEDEFEIRRPPRGYPQGLGGGRSPYNIGDRDLYPPGMAPHDPLRGPMGPGFGSGGGMHPTFDDPLFGGPGGGSGVYDPRAPPGARYDPVGPGDPPLGRYQGPRGPFGRGGPGGDFGGGYGGFGGGFGGGDII
ncbi:Proteasome Inhibitor PI31 [Penicillium argentinense]|uniref:Proteasome Inhibitor PI31 n=1 Tax=Penicillium argentinense TaxID=1131581 RepID=A0A9W9KAG4_9EURO|nr:Proteasome Inhibitor PI31 [Penicillium argentinense]KAJ5097937.1 Proteasome Inhibitor PI31 [Penicillium argentinense]